MRATSTTKCWPKKPAKLTEQNEAKGAGLKAMNRGGHTVETYSKGENGIGSQRDKGGKCSIARWKDN